MAKVEGYDGKIIGKRCPVFDYTEKKIVLPFRYVLTLYPLEDG